jgi:hypothetical protein
MENCRSVKLLHGQGRPRLAFTWRPCSRRAKPLPSSYSKRRKQLEKLRSKQRRSARTPPATTPLLCSVVDGLSGRGSIGVLPVEGRPDVPARGENDGAGSPDHSPSTGPSPGVLASALLDPGTSRAGGIDCHSPCCSM